MYIQVKRWLPDEYKKIKVFSCSYWKTTLSVL